MERDEIPVSAAAAIARRPIDEQASIGELSRELETAERKRTDLHPTDGKQTKAETLRAAGISTSSANRFEQLADNADEVEAYIARASLHIQGT